MRNYIALIFQNTETHYSAVFPDLPGCMAEGTSFEEARAFAADALAVHLDGLDLYGQTIPVPSAIETILYHPQSRGSAATYVTPSRDGTTTTAAPMQDRSVSVNLPKNILRQIDAWANSRGLSRSAFLMRAAKHELERMEALAC